MPPPYEDVQVGEEIPVVAFWKDDNELVCEARYRGDVFGGGLNTEGLQDLELTVEIDKLVGGVCFLVWNELLGVPTFRDEDEEIVGRVAAQRSWEKVGRQPTQGYVKTKTNGDDPAERRDVVAAAVGDADVTELRLTQEEMAALMRGEIPEALTERLLKARSTENLIASVEEALLATVQESGEFSDLDRAVREIQEVRRRFTHT